jgi:plasmid stabilization system protein ParE
VKPLVILAAAAEEFAESSAWYRRRSIDAMNAFEAAVGEALDRIRNTPDRWPMCGGDYRSCLIDHFPYHLVYREEATQVVVVAVAHAKRRFGYWKRR